MSAPTCPPAPAHSLANRTSRISRLFQGREFRARGSAFEYLEPHTAEMRGRSAPHFARATQSTPRAPIPRPPRTARRRTRAHLEEMLLVSVVKSGKLPVLRPMERYGAEVRGRPPAHGCGELTRNSDHEIVWFFRNNCRRVAGCGGVFAAFLPDGRRAGTILPLRNAWFLRFIGRGAGARSSRSGNVEIKGLLREEV